MLAALGMEFEIVAPEVDELRDADSADSLVRENARLKGSAVLATAPAGSTVIAADTEVFLEGRSLGKPQALAEARQHLEALSGRTHEVLTGLVILGPEAGEERSGVDRAEVTFRDLDEDLLRSYLASEEWRDRAGGYAIQGLGSTFVAALAGDLSNVVGLPIGLLVRLAPEFVKKSHS